MRRFWYNFKNLDSVTFEFDFFFPLFFAFSHVLSPLHHCTPSNKVKFGTYFKYALDVGKKTFYD